MSDPQTDDELKQKELIDSKESLCDQDLPQMSNQALTTTPPRAQQPRPKTPDSYDRVPREQLTPTKVRGRRRKDLPGYTCEKCEKYYKAAGLSQKDVQKCTRHRGTKRQRSPAGYWNPGWESPPKTPKKFIPEKLKVRKTFKESGCIIV